MEVPGGFKRFQRRFKGCQRASWGVPGELQDVSLCSRCFLGISVAFQVISEAFQGFSIDLRNDPDYFSTVSGISGVFHGVSRAFQGFKGHCRAF